MKLFKLIGWGQPAVGCVISREWMGEGGGLYYCNMVVVVGNSLLAGEGAFLQAKVEKIFSTWAWEMPVIVSLAGRSVGRRKKLCLALSLSKQWIQLGPVFWG